VITHTHTLQRAGHENDPTAHGKDPPRLQLAALGPELDGWSMSQFVVRQVSGPTRAWHSLVCAIIYSYINTSRRFCTANGIVEHEGRLELRPMSANQKVKLIGLAQNLSQP
jgi:hypothetical protein